MSKLKVTNARRQVRAHGIPVKCDGDPSVAVGGRGFVFERPFKCNPQIVVFLFEFFIPNRRICTQ